MHAALAALPLPFLRQWLQHSLAQHTITLTQEDMRSPLERAWADTLSWPADAAHPWAALAAQGQSELPPAPPDQAWAFIRLCHWHVGNGQFTLMDADPIEAQESQALLDAMRPYFAEDGIALHPYLPGQWLASSPLFKGLVGASMSRVMGLPIEPWLLGAHLPSLPPAIQTLRRLQNEMQMLLYQHPVNETRPRPLNSIWIEGCGHLGEETPAPPAAGPAVVTIDDLRVPWLLRDAAGWAHAWARLDAEVLPALLQPAGARIAWCGQRQARWWCHQTPGIWERLQRLLKPATPAEVLACDA
jgi:hypothetical protein